MYNAAVFSQKVTIARPKVQVSPKFYNFLNQLDALETKTRLVDQGETSNLVSEVCEGTPLKLSLRIQEKNEKGWGFGAYHFHLYAEISFLFRFFRTLL